MEQFCKTTKTQIIPSAINHSGRISGFICSYSYWLSLPYIWLPLGATNYNLTTKIRKTNKCINCIKIQCEKATLQHEFMRALCSSSGSCRPGKVLEFVIESRTTAGPIMKWPVSQDLRPHITWLDISGRLFVWGQGNCYALLSRLRPSSGSDGIRSSKMDGGLVCLNIRRGAGETDKKIG